MPIPLSKTWRMPRGARNVVLRRLKEEGILTEDAVAQAMNRPVKVMLNQDVLTDAPYFVDHLLREIEQGTGLDIPDGARIYSTLDPRAQRIVARALHEGLAKLEKSYPALAGVEPPLQGAAVSWMSRPVTCVRWSAVVTIS